jgi:hypothetical protein
MWDMQNVSLKHSKLSPTAKRSCFQQSGILACSNDEAASNRAPSTCDFNALPAIVRTRTAQPPEAEAHLNNM